MHEWSLAHGIVSSLLDLISSGKLKKIKYVKISVGQLVQIDREVLFIALQELSRETPLEGTVFDIVEEETTFRCNNCGHVWSWREVLQLLEREVSDSQMKTMILEAAHLVPTSIFAFTRCPNCGSPNFEILTGLDVKVVEILGE